MEKLIKYITKERIVIEQMRVDNPSKEFTVFTIYALLYILIVLVFAHVIKVFPMPIMHGASFTDDIWYVVFTKVLFLLIVPVLIYVKFGYTVWSLFEYKYPTFGKNLKVILISFVIGLIMNQSHIPKIVKIIKDIDLGLLLPLGVAIIIPFFAAASPEELFYRVILQTRIEKKYGWLTSIVLSSALFSLFHFPSRFILSTGVEGTAGNVLSITVGTLLPTFIVGIVLGFLWNRYRNVLLLLAFHYSIDLLPSISSMLGIEF